MADGAKGSVVEGAGSLIEGLIKSAKLEDLPKVLREDPMRAAEIIEEIRTLANGVDLMTDYYRNGQGKDVPLFVDEVRRWRSSATPPSRPAWRRPSPKPSWKTT